MRNDLADIETASKSASGSPPDHDKADGIIRPAGPGISLRKHE